MNKQKALSMGIQAFVMKPFIIKDVAETIREVLESTWPLMCNNVLLTCCDIRLHNL